eukprot:scaffold519_cov331-Pavlova_lutheri.AAC.6
MFQFGFPSLPRCVCRPSSRPTNGPLDLPRCPPHPSNGRKRDGKGRVCGGEGEETRKSQAREHVRETHPFPHPRWVGEGRGPRNKGRRRSNPGSMPSHTCTH